MPSNTTRTAPVSDARTFMTVKTLVFGIKVLELKVLAGTGLDFIAQLARTTKKHRVLIWGPRAAESRRLPKNTSCLVVAKGIDSRKPASLAIKGKDFGYDSALSIDVCIEILVCESARQSDNASGNISLLSLRQHDIERQRGNLAQNPHPSKQSPSTSGWFEHIKVWGSI